MYVGIVPDTTGLGDLDVLVYYSLDLTVIKELISDIRLSFFNHIF